MPLPEWELAARQAACTSCGASNEARVFPAAFEPRTAVQPQPALEGDAACFDHPDKCAVAACQQCGRFVCRLCEVESGGGVWCPSCVAGRAGAAAGGNPENSRILFDSIALITPLIILLMWPLTAIAGPGAVALSIVKWKAPLSLVRRSRWRFVAAIVIGLAETGGWIWGIAYLLLLARAKAR